MPYALRLSRELARLGWKVKIRDFERLEPPHITVFRGMRTWRVSLRTHECLDRGDRWNQIDGRVREAIDDAWATLCEEWDRLYPHNPVSSEEDDD